MKFYDCSTAPSPRRVRIFFAEKQIKIPFVQVDLANGEQFGDAFRRVNPDTTVPVLELDDGTRITDLMGICRYFEELYPEPALFGESAQEKAQIDGWNRWCDREGFFAVIDAFRNSTPGLKGRALPGPDDFEQIDALAQRGRARIASFFRRLNRELASRPYVAGENFSIADITALVSIDFSGWMKVRPAPEHVHLSRWYETVSKRPSSKA